MSEQGSPPEPILENRLPAEGINSSSEHPLREFAWLLTAALSVLLAVTLLIGWGAKWLAPLVPFSAEVALAERVVDHPPKTAQLPRHEALQSLADRLAARMDLPEGMTLMVRFDDSPVVNAYATFGGRIRVFEGLLRELKCEDALAALLAHEIAHVKHRHVAAQMGRGMALSLLLAAVSSEAGAAAAQAALGNAAGLVLMGYSREQEAQADEEALRAVVALYGHAGGVVSLFESLGPASERGPSIEVLRSHPLTSARIDAALASARQAGWPTAGELTALPAALSFTQRP